jgi:hypothetical protein
MMDVMAIECKQSAVDTVLHRGRSSFTNTLLHGMHLYVLGAAWIEDYILKLSHYL